MDSRKFQRRTENFICEHCAQNVVGNGFTNHCPVCLWSKHVDINPGDRAAECGGAMEPVRIEIMGGEHWIHHRCHQCGLERRIRSVREDSFEALLSVARQGSLKGR